ncbi:MAG: N-acetylmuramic acid 6-phosphate etherase, partial [Planctomycetota bacterium]
MTDRTDLLTERRLPASMRLDTMSAGEIVAVMNEQDQVAQQAVVAIADHVSDAADRIAMAFREGGRLLYFGAGTSGRLGVLDASECPPTFRSDPTQVQGIIAGGREAMFAAQEGAEDSREDGAKAVADLDVGQRDVVCGIAAGGTTPFVHGALAAAKSAGATTLFLTCVQASDRDPPARDVDVWLRPLVGPEVLTGSTRLKAGTATKLVLNQLTTTAMVRLGKCYENL